MKPFRARTRTLRIATIAAISFLAGATEAFLLAVIAQIAVILSADATSADVTLGSIGSIHLGVRSLLLVGVVLTAMRLVLQGITVWLSADLAVRQQTGLRRALISAFLAADHQGQCGVASSHAQTLIGPHTDRASMIDLYRAIAVTALANLVALGVVAFYISPTAALAIGGCAAFLFLVLRPAAKAVRRVSREQSGNELALSHDVEDIIRLSDEVRTFGVSDAMEQRASTGIERVGRSFFRSNLFGLGLPALYQTVAMALALGGLAIASTSGSQDLAAVGAVFLLVIRSFAYGQQLQAAFQASRQLEPFAERVEEEMSKLQQARRSYGCAPLPFVASMHVRDGAFGYQRGLVLDRVNFSITRGEAVAVVGPSGAGKSTLLRVLARHLELDRGSYRVNGASASSYDVAAWSRAVALVPQEPRIMSGTVFENIRFMRPWVSLEDAQGAARSARIGAEIEALPRGFDTLIDERGDALSGGQRQRIAIARALAGHPSVLLLDEPTSAVDGASEALIRDSLTAVKRSMAIVVVAHRPSMLRLCDRVIVLGDGGAIEADGTMEDVTAGSAYFRSAFA